MDQAVRNKLRNVVTQCRKLLEDATGQALQGRFGIYAASKKGEVQIEDEARMAHLTEDDRACRQDLLDHLAHIQAIGYKPSEALEQLIREIAFTHLNRLCAYKIMEARGLIREAVSRGLKSQGFFFYLANHPDDEKLHKNGQQEVAYRNFLDWLGGTLSEEIGVLFNPDDPANRIYPPQRVLDDVLVLINDGELKGIWSQDETIGWVYQYFTPKELRDKARKESQAPRNSYELAFRNQFFTPRYVVEFLTDNTLGRIWYEMRKGETALKDCCRYLVRRPTEIFLNQGEEPPTETKQTRDDLSQEELLKQPVHIPHRPKKDPREIMILDPACGSGHFLLYCFDLLQVIYEEAYDDPDLGTIIRKDYPTIDELRQAVPGLILKCNLHGIDIDLRATQIAALALWLRCQRAYQELGLKNNEKPKITRSNIVCAEPMPGEIDLLKEFTASLQPKVLGQLVELVFQKMKFAGEAGSLLKIEEEIHEAAAKARDDYIKWKKQQKEASEFLIKEVAPQAQPNLLDFADLNDEAFLDQAEEEIVSALRQYSEKISNGKSFQRRLFAEDAARGFAFVDVCRKKYDVVLMNPPYGDHSLGTSSDLQSCYPHSGQDIYSCFYQRAVELAQESGCVGALTSRTFLLFSSFRALRDFLLSHCWIMFVADLGHGVLDDAMVETCLFVGQTTKDGGVSWFARLLRENEKATNLEVACQAPTNALVYWVSQSAFAALPGSPISYWAGDTLRKIFSELPSFASTGAMPTLGLVSADNERFLRLRWEVQRERSCERWPDYCKGGDYTKYYDDPHLVVDWRGDGQHIEQTHGSAVRLRDKANYFRTGITYPLVTNLGMNARILPRGCIFDNAAPAILSNTTDTIWLHLGVLNTRVFEYLARLLTTSRHWQVGYVRAIPFPQFEASKKEEIERRVKECFDIRRQWDTYNETSHVFVMPLIVHIRGEIRTAIWKILSDWEKRAACMHDHAVAIDNIVLQSYGLGQDFINSLNEELIYNATTYDFLGIAPDSKACLPSISDMMSMSPATKASAKAISECRHKHAESFYIDMVECWRGLWSFSTGCIFGRWDINFTTGARQPPELPHPFDPLPVCPPGMLQGPDGLPAKPEDVPSDYPIRINWDGILVDDPEHEDDIIRRIHDVLERIWKNLAEAIEKEACEILGTRELRDYFRKPSNGGFWMDHVKRYSKSRRKAPIYWYLRSAKGNFGLWFYYHRLDKDILFKALLNYVEPKIRLEEDRLNTLRSRKEAVGSSGREAKQIEKDMDHQEQFVSELHDFKDKLRRAADLHLEPDLNDGVVLNIAPLWELVPWKEAKKYWEELNEGKYEWSSIGKQLRQKGLIR